MEGGNGCCFVAFFLIITAMKYIFAVLFLPVLLFSVGCSGKVPLGGKVTFSDDGSPGTRGVVFFMSPPLVAQGGINPDGTYRVGSRVDEERHVLGSA